KNLSGNSMPAPEVKRLTLPSASVTTTTCADPDPLALTARRDPSRDQTGAETTTALVAGNFAGALMSAFATQSCQPPGESVAGAQEAIRLPSREYTGLECSAPSGESATAFGSVATLSLPVHAVAHIAPSMTNRLMYRLPVSAATSAPREFPS